MAKRNGWQPPTSSPWRSRKGYGATLTLRLDDVCLGAPNVGERRCNAANALCVGIEKPLLILRQQSAMSTPESESSNKYHRERLFPSTMLEIGSQRSASQVTDTEIVHGRFLWSQPEGRVLDALLLAPGYNQPILETLQAG